MQAHGDDHPHLLHHADGQLLVPRRRQYDGPAGQHAGRGAVDLQIPRRLQRDENGRQTIGLVYIISRIHDRLQMLREIFPRPQDEHGVLAVRVQVIAQEIAVHRAAGGRLQQQGRVGRDGDLRLRHAHVRKLPAGKIFPQRDAVDAAVEDAGSMAAIRLATHRADAAAVHHNTAARGVGHADGGEIIVE